MEILWKGTVSAKFRNSTFFHTYESNQIAVIMNINLDDIVTTSVNDSVGIDKLNILYNQIFHPIISAQNSVGHR